MPLCTSTEQGSHGHWPNLLVTGPIGIPRTASRASSLSSTPSSSCCVLSMMMLESRLERGHDNSKYRHPSASHQPYRRCRRGRTSGGVLPIQSSQSIAMNHRAPWRRHLPYHGWCPPRTPH